MHLSVNIELSSGFGSLVWRQEAEDDSLQFAAVDQDGTLCLIAEARPEEIPLSQLSCIHPNFIGSVRRRIGQFGSQDQFHWICMVPLARLRQMILKHHGITSCGLSLCPCCFDVYFVSIDHCAVAEATLLSFTKSSIVILVDNSLLVHVEVLVRT